MWLLSERTSVARKKYRCDASARILEVDYYEDFTPEEMALVEKIRDDGCFILPGQTYKRAVYLEGGSLHTYRALPEMDAIAAKYDMWWED